MKIEKISDKQIRCTLTREDLANREIKLAELAYGSDKAKALFQDMMQVAAQDFGFEADNTPLVIEAIPLSMDSIILIITKVDDPEELDTRFSRFSPEDPDAENGVSFSDLKDRIEGADDILGLIKKITEAKKQAASSEPAQKKQTAEQKEDVPPEHEDEELRRLTRFYMFRSLDHAIRAAGVLGTMCTSPSSLYKDPENGEYYLLVKKAKNSAQQFNKICNVLSEYGQTCRFHPAMEAHFSEHMETILREHALEDLQKLQ
ncbi:MAG: adaptor protein MecA [Lachnospiraceae bacterium]|uniref:adaptor protein MecA n=1 Tax=Parablautia sp. Marseille-Q6255 TaxID=3039593 RepID=UPI0024BCD958|nr:adaptor protein MecA [Parablautia sp. Marseille-Q6255]